MKTDSIITQARIASQRQGGFNPVANLTPQSLTSQITNFKAGYLSSLAYTFEAIEERDYALQTDAPKRYKSVSRIPWEIAILDGYQQDAEAQRHAAALRHFYNNVECAEALEPQKRGGFPMLVRTMARAFGHRYSIHELIWQPRDPVWETINDKPVLREGLTAQAIWVPLYFFESRTGALRFIREPYGLDGVEMPEGEWLTTIGDGLLIASVICWMYKRLSFQDWVTYNGKFGIPGIHGKTDAAKDSPEWNNFVEAVQDFANDWYAVTNMAGTIELLKADGGATLPMRELVTKMDDAITKMWRGGNLASQTSDKAGDVGANIQGDERDLLEADDAEVITETLNTQLDPFIIRWYFGENVSPLAYVRLAKPKKQNAAVELAIDNGLAALGVLQSKQAVAERYGRTIAGKGEEAVSSPPSAVSPEGAGPSAPPFRRAANYDPNQPRDEDGQWAADGGSGRSPFAVGEGLQPNRRKYTIDQSRSILAKRGLVSTSATEKTADGQLVQVFTVTHEKTGAQRRMTPDQKKLLLADIEREHGKVESQRDFRSANAAPAAPVRPLADSPAQLLAAATAADLAPVRARLDAILALDDEAAFRSELAALQAELPQLLQTVNREPRTANILEKIIGTALLEGLTAKETQS
jgi:hypothetical protein